MATMTQDCGSWDNSCCALKLVKLAAGNFEFDHADQQPSWAVTGSSTPKIISEGSRTTIGGLLSAGQQHPAENNRSQWSRPWREARRFPSLRWEKSGTAAQRRVPTICLPTGTNGQSSPKRVLIDLSSALRPPPSAPEYTTKYFGVVGGELGVMSKVEPFSPGPMSENLPHVPAMPLEVDLEQGLQRRHTSAKRTSSKAEAVATPAIADVAQPEGGRPRSTPPEDIPGGKCTFSNTRGELSLAETLPAAKPVEGPEPPAWSGSRLALLGEPSEGGGVSEASLGSAGATETVADSASQLNPSSNSLGGGLVLKNRDDSSSFALSLGSTPRALSEDEDGEEARSSQSFFQSARDLRPTSTDAGKPTRAAPVRSMLAGLKKPKRRRREGRWTDARVVNSTAKSTRFRTLLRNGVEEHGGRGGAVAIESGSASPREPQPAQYDAWIPHSSFQGKGLPTAKRVRQEWEPHPPFGTKSPAVIHHRSTEISKRMQTSQAVEWISEERHHLGHAKECHKPVAVASERHAVRYVCGPVDIAGRSSSPASTRAGAGERTRSSQATFNRHNGSFAGKGASTAPVKEAAGVELESGHESISNRKTTATSGGGGGVSGGAAGGHDGVDDDDGDGEGPALVRDGTAVVVGSSIIVGWQEQEEELEEEEEGGEERKQEEDEEYFDYAKIFSWQTAAEVAKVAETEAEAGSHEQRRQQRTRGDEDGMRREEACQLREAAAVTAAASERARVRSDHAALAAVGRLRAPQSVFSPRHRTPRRPEMRRFITHGRFSPIGRKIWRQSEGLSPRTGQLCLSPRLRGRGGAGGIGIFPCTGGGAFTSADWGDLRSVPSVARVDESQWGTADSAAGNANQPAVADTARVVVGDGWDACGRDRVGGTLDGRMSYEERGWQEKGLVEQEGVAEEGGRVECLMPAFDRTNGNSQINLQEAGDPRYNGGDREHVAATVDPDGVTRMADDRGKIYGGAEIACIGGGGAECPYLPLTSSPPCLSYTVKIPWSGQT